MPGLPRVSPSLAVSYHTGLLNYHKLSINGGKEKTVPVWVGLVARAVSEKKVKKKKKVGCRSRNENG